MNERTDMQALANQTSRLLALITSIRESHELDFEEQAIYFALGLANFDATWDIYPFMKPVSAAEISSRLGLSAETVRRKLSHIVALGLALKTEKGFVMTDLGIWQRLRELGMQTDGGNKRGRVRPAAI